jgi:hypothetical protein
MVLTNTAFLEWKKILPCKTLQLDKIQPAGKAETLIEVVCPRFVNTVLEYADQN